MVTKHDTTFNIKKILRGADVTFVCFVWIREQTATSVLRNTNKLVFKTEVERVYCAVRTETLHKTDAFGI